MHRELDPQAQGGSQDGVHAGTAAKHSVSRTITAHNETFRYWAAVDVVCVCNIDAAVCVCLTTVSQPLGESLSCLNV